MAEIIRFTTPVFRASFPHFFKAQSGPEGGEPKYSVSAIWTPGDFTDKEKALWKKILTALDEEAKKRFKKSMKDLKALNAEGGNFKLVPRNGATKADMEGYGDGTVFANLTTKMRPGLIDLQKRPIVSTADEAMIQKYEDEGRDYVVDDNGSIIYPGCYCRATVTVYSYDNKGKGIALGLMNVQKVKDGDRLDSRTDAAADFDDDLLDDLDDGTEDFLDDDL